MLVLQDQQMGVPPTHLCHASSQLAMSLNRSLCWPAEVCPDGPFAWTAARSCGASPAELAYASGNQATHEHVLQQLHMRLAATSAGEPAPPTNALSTVTGSQCEDAMPLCILHW